MQITTTYRPLAGVLTFVSLLTSAGLVQARVSGDPIGRADAFLQSQGLNQARRGLAADEKAALGRALATPNRQLSDKTLAHFLRNPTAWSGNGANGRGLLRTIVKSLPDVAAVPGVDNTLHLSSNPNAANYRGYGVEVIASAALSHFRTDRGERAQMTRMGAQIRGIDGRVRESDGAALIGADGVERLVTVKSLSSIKSMKGTLNKAADQLALRNIQRDGSRRPGVMVVGYDDPDIYASLKRKNWQASADRTGAKLLVLAVNHLTGKTEKLASYSPDPKSTYKPKRPKIRKHRGGKNFRGRRNSLLGQTATGLLGRGLLGRGFVGRRSPSATRGLSRFLGGKLRLGSRR